MKTICLLPRLPYHLSVFIFVNYLALRDSDFKDVLVTGDVKQNDKFDDFIDRFDEKTKPLQYAYCTISWIWLFLKLTLN